MESRLYEGMFLVDAAMGGEDFPAVVQHIVGHLDRYGAEPQRIEKWAENKLAYSIRGTERGIYVLIYFQADPERIAEMRHDLQLSEDILRVLILRTEADKMRPPQGTVYEPDGTEIEPEPKAEEAEGTAEPEAAEPEAAEPEAAEPEAAEPEAGEDTKADESTEG